MSNKTSATVKRSLTKPSSEDSNNPGPYPPPTPHLQPTTNPPVPIMEQSLSSESSLPRQADGGDVLETMMRCIQSDVDAFIKEDVFAEYFLTRASPMLQYAIEFRVSEVAERRVPGGQRPRQKSSRQPLQQPIEQPIKEEKGGRNRKAQRRLKKITKREFRRQLRRTLKIKELKKEMKKDTQDISDG